jgi:hypothetical protein
MDAHVRDIVVFGYSSDVETLLRHLDLEAPSMLQRIVVVDPRPGVLQHLRSSDIEGRVDDPRRFVSLHEAGLHGATTVLSLSIPGTDIPGGVPVIVQRMRHAHRSVRILAVATDCAHASELRLAGADEVFHREAPGVLHDALSRSNVISVVGRVFSWRFAALIGITLVDAIVFVIPVTAAAMLVAAAVAPEWLRRAARFLDQLAGPSIGTRSEVRP